MKGAGFQWSEESPRTLIAAVVPHDGRSERRERFYAARREYDCITPASFEVQAMSSTRTVVASPGGAVKSGGR